MNTVDCSKVIVYHKKDDVLVDYEFCKHCDDDLKKGNHLVYVCDPCCIRTFICEKCMKEKIVEVTMCEMVNEEENKVGYYAMENGKLHLVGARERRLHRDFGTLVISHHCLREYVRQYRNN